MATSYPGALDSFTDPGASLAGPPTHESMHEDMIDAMEAVQTELGVNGKNRTMRSYANATARDAEITSPVAGNIAFLEDIDRVTVYDGSAWLDPMDEWRPRFGEHRSGAMTESYTSTQTEVAVDSAYTFVMPTSWNTYDINVYGVLRWEISGGDNVYGFARLSIDGDTDQFAHYYNADNHRSSAVLRDQATLTGYETGLSGNCTIQPRIVVTEIAGTSQQLNLVQWYVQYDATRVT